MTAKDFRELLQRWNLPADGNKTMLKERVWNKLQNKNENRTDEDERTLANSTMKPNMSEYENNVFSEKNVILDENDEAEQNSYTEVENHNQRRRTDVPSSASFMTFRDFENAVQEFTVNERIEHWIDEIEDFNRITKWNDIELYIYVKRLLKGSVQQFIRTQRNVNTWKKLKDLLMDEFSIKIDTAMVHEQLRLRVKNPNESYREYVYAMHNIALQIELEESSLIRYIVDGIDDNTSDQIILEGAKTLKELKEKLESYERLKARLKIAKKFEKADVKNFTNKTYQRTPNEDGKPNVTKCFNCGLMGHLSKDCPDASKGPKCFKCNLYGHKRYNEVRNEVNIIKRNIMNVAVEINDQKFTGLVDTGSNITIIKEKHVKTIKPKFVGKLPTMISGLNSNLWTKGMFKAKIKVQQEQVENFEVN